MAALVTGIGWEWCIRGVLWRCCGDLMDHGDVEGLWWRRCGDLRLLLLGDVTEEAKRLGYDSGAVDVAAEAMRSCRFLMPQRVWLPTPCPAAVITVYLYNHLSLLEASSAE